MIYFELGTKPLLDIIKSRMINYWSRIVNNDEHRLNNILYNLLLQKFVRDAPKFRWLKFIKDTLDECGLSYIWFNQTLRNFNEKWLNLTIKQILSDQTQQAITSEMNNSSKASCYRLFKTSLKFEKYLDILNDKERNIFCKFRTTNHKLIIEVGRWGGVNKENRICTLCNHGLVGDEFHYLLECQYFNEEREHYLEEKYLRYPNVIKFNELMNSSSLPVLKKLCKFIQTICSVASCPPLQYFFPIKCVDLYKIMLHIIIV